LMRASAVVNRQSAVAWFGVATLEPGLDLAFERGPVGDAAVEALPGQHGQLRFRHVEPAAVLGRVVPLEALDKAACLLRRERLVECGRHVGVRLSWTSTMLWAEAK